MKYICVSFCLLFLSYQGFSHPLHVSYTKIQLQDSTIQLLTKIFSDDLELSTQIFHNKTILDSVDYENYIMQNCKIFVGNSLCEFRLIKRIEQDDADWFYFESTIQSEVCNIAVYNSLLLNLYDDQQNLIIISCKNQEKGFSLNYNLRMCSL